MIPGNNIPSLKALHLHYNDCDNPGVPDMTDPNIWVYLKALISRKIFFRFLQIVQRLIWLFHFSVQFTNLPRDQNSDPLSNGSFREIIIFTNIGHFGKTSSINMHESQRYDIDIRNLSPSSRNYTLLGCPESLTIVRFQNQRLHIRFNLMSIFDFCQEQYRTSTSLFKRASNQASFPP